MARRQFNAILIRCAVCLGALAGLVSVNRWISEVNPTTAALYMLLAVLTAATKWGLTESVFTSLAGVLAFNYYFLPPIGTFRISDPENLVALFAFLVTAVTASKLSSSAKRRAEEATLRQSEIAKLYELSRALLMEEGRDTVRNSIVRAGQILQIGDIAFFDAAENQVYGSLTGLAPDMTTVAKSGEEMVKNEISIIPVRMGTQSIGSFAAAQAALSPTVRDSVASLLAINYERAHAVDRAAAAEIARRNEEFRSSLLDGLAHDLKTPLTAVRTCITRLIEIPPRTEAVRQELLSIIDQESGRLQSTITDVIELARVESNDLRLEQEITSVAELVEIALGQTGEEDRTRYSLHVPADLHFTVDRQLFQRALLQVLENARKYTPPDSVVEIEAKLQGGDTHLSVLDRGPGFDSGELELIFRKFYRGHRRRDQPEGTGMGLAIARSIIEAHGGRIRAENRLGGGGAIVITLPAPDNRLEN